MRARLVACRELAPDYVSLPKLLHVLDLKRNKF